MLLQNAYDAIAMDHFALSKDEMAKAFKSRTLYRNFMGYTLKYTEDFIGIGVTSIGFLENTFIQNVGELWRYYKMTAAKKFPISRGKRLNRDDSIRQWIINELMCRFQIDKSECSRIWGVNFDAYFSYEQTHIENCLREGLLTKEGEERFIATELGKLFIRNVCMGFDWYLRQKRGNKRFSQTV